MRNFANNFEELILRRGLYRVWVPLHDDGKAPLISIWVDPAMGAFEPRGEKKTCDRAPEQALLSGLTVQTGEEAEGQDDRTRWTVSS
jgi:hypothetical protein